MPNQAELIKKLEVFEELCINFATGRDFDYSNYEGARNEILSDPELQALLPKWVVENRYGSQFWRFIKERSSTYRGRREFIRDSFAASREALEAGGSEPVSLSVQDVIRSIKHDEVERLWKKISLRKRDDPEGAITASRTMLETVIKYILREKAVVFQEKEDLPDLYKKAAKALELSPEGRHENEFKAVLSGVTSIVVGIGALRNKYGDSHSKEEGRISPEKRHAELVINLAGAMSTFLLETYRAQQGEPAQPEN